MTPSDTSASAVQALIQSLKTVPEVRLRLVELAWECSGPDGQLDMAEAASRMKEIEDSADQAQALIKATESVRWALTGHR